MHPVHSHHHYHHHHHHHCVTEGYEGPCDLHFSPNIVRVIKARRMRWAGHVARVVERRGVYKDFVGKPEGKRPLRRPSRRREDNIKMDIQVVGWGRGAHGLDRSGSG
jgi:hypothetical protein